MRGNIFGVIRLVKLMRRLVHVKIFVRNDRLALDKLLREGDGTELILFVGTGVIHKVLAGSCAPPGRLLKSIATRENRRHFSHTRTLILLDAVFDHAAFPSPVAKFFDDSFRGG